MDRILTSIRPRRTTTNAIALLSTTLFVTSCANGETRHMNGREGEAANSNGAGTLALGEPRDLATDLDVP